VIARAIVVLEALEKGERERSGQKAMIDELPLFSATPASTSVVASGPSELEQALADIHPDDLRPIEALQLLYKLKELKRDK